MGKKAKKSELGRALTRRKEQDAKAGRTNRRTVEARMAAATGRHTTAHDDGSGLQSVLDATDLEQLMLNAAMANDDFGTERHPGPLAPQTVVVTPLAHHGPVLPTRERGVRRELDRTILRIPRRPPWNTLTTYEDLMTREAERFLQWRRKIASTEQEHSLASTLGGPMMTPFEKNIEVWRQLWRVVERSDVVVQIVDARNPLLYYCEDLYRYVTDEMQRAHLLVLNKSDMLSSEMIGKWEEYFKSKSIDVLFFSAFKASVKETTADWRVLGAQALIDKLGMYDRKAPQTQENQRIVVGMCGYPNVGKSSTINVLLETVATQNLEETSNEDKGATLENRNNEEVRYEELELRRSPEEDEETERTHEGSTVELEKHGTSSGKPTKRVAVSSTPGKTKHFQTLVLTDRILVCDCPGLVFPNFSSSKAELICAGVLSIDQMRGDHMTPVSLIASRIPAGMFEAVYGIRFAEVKHGIYEDGDDSQEVKPNHVSAGVLLNTHARARGFMTDHGRADTSRSARVLLKDFVNGRVIYAHGADGGGESGVGPGVFAKKGSLVYERQEAWNQGKSGAGEKGSLDDGVLESESKNEQVRARVSGRKKHAAAEFVRVERSYFPAEWGQNG